MPNNAQFYAEFIRRFDEYCEDAQDVEDRRWTQKEFQRMKDFALWMEVVYHSPEVI